jgi:predicted transcriptional regulator
MTPRNKLLQSLYLEPEQAKLLDEIAEETRIPKAVLLREAVDDLLSRYRKGVISTRYVKLRAALKGARAQLSAYRRMISERKLGLVPLQACDRAIDQIDEARASIGD